MSTSSHSSARLMQQSDVHLSLLPMKVLYLPGRCRSHASDETSGLSSRRNELESVRTGRFGGGGGVLCLLEPSADCPPPEEYPLASGSRASCPVVVLSFGSSGKKAFVVFIGAGGGGGVNLWLTPNDGV